MSDLREDLMPSRLQLALNVSDLGQAVAFYTKLFGTEPAKLRPGYANFAIAEPPLKLVLLENPGQGGSLNHLGVEVPDTGTVAAEQARLAQAGLAPAQEPWEIYAVLADSPTFYADGHGPECCGDTNVHAGEPPASAARCC
jgi:catechol 2,3-dioxygenase-like lactoylglutathione lyase family enzyme